ncbi:MAG: Swt1 family HEPN domain-containing protein [Planctomycetaceae bacterium]
MKDTISSGLNLLATGLRPYVAERAASVSSDPRILADIEHGDAQFLLVLMWDRWNEMFRQDLSFVERSLISELRDFRNRWAHQDQLTEQDKYRVMDDIERLLRSINSDQAVKAADLRRESLNRLWQAEIGNDNEGRTLRILWPFLLCLTSAAALCFAFFGFLGTPWNGILSALVVLGLFRLAWYQSLRDSVRTAGPKECRDCGKIIYTIECPYCRPAELKAEAESAIALSQPLSGLGIVQRLTGSMERRRSAAANARLK